MLDMAPATTKSPNPIDIHVGSRVRLRRMMIGMSQERLGEKLSLTFQQVQKYEKGANRIGASRLYTIASIFEVPVSFFYEDMPSEITDEIPHFGDRGRNVDDSARLMNFVASAEGLQLNTSFSKIGNVETRRKLVDLVKTLVNAG